MLTILQSFDTWNKLERWKSSVSGCLMCWLKIFLNHVLKCHLSLILYNSESLLKLWHVMKSGFYATTSSVVERRNSKALAKAKLAPKERLWSLFGGLLSVWSTTAFWIPAKPLHLRHMLSKSMRYTKTAMPEVSNGQQNGRNSPPQHPATCHTTNTSKVEWIRLQSFASSTIFTWPFANWLPLLQASWLLFAGKTLPQPPECRKCFPSIHQILKHGFFTLKE